MHVRFLIPFGRNKRLWVSRSLSSWAAQFIAAAFDLPSVALNDGVSYCFPCVCADNVSVFHSNIRSLNVNQYHL